MNEPLHFTDRHEAGVRLAKKLSRYDSEDTVVYALPRGGVAVGAAVAAQLEAPLALVIVRKVGHPDNEEYAVCAVTEEGVRVCNEEEAGALNPEWLEAATARAQGEAQRRRAAYGEPPVPATGKIAIVVDDGMATGLSMRAAVRALRRELPSELVVAVPVAPKEVADLLRSEADDVVVLDESESFSGAIGTYYDSFAQVSDDEVRALLQEVAS